MHIPLKSLTSEFAILAIRFYQGIITPMIQAILYSTTGHYSRCKHHPTCSQYTINQIRKHGTITGLKNGAVRIWNCR